MFKTLCSWWLRAWRGERQAAAPMAAEVADVSPVASVDGSTPHLQSAVVPADSGAVAQPAPGSPYDESLLDKAKTQWQRGDWDSLVQLQPETLEHHPERAKLALLVAAAHAQQGHHAQARQLTQLAQDWGCSMKLISQVLISGAYHSMGHAMLAAGRSDKALSYLQQAVALGVPNADLNLLGQVRAFPQLEKLGLPADGLAHTALPDTRTAPSAVSIGQQLQPLQASVQALAQTLQTQQVELTAQLKKQNDDLIAVRKFLDSSLKKEVANAARQMEAYMAVQHYLTTGVVSQEMHGWPISPDFALYLIDLIETRNYDLVIEFGSGVSTVLMAQALTKCRARTGAQKPAVQVAFEHLAPYHAQTLTHLVQAGVSDAVQLVHAPLADYQAPNGKICPYYSCSEELSKISKTIDSKTAKILVLVDGPPAATGKHARYPALPVVLRYFQGSAIDFLMDDYIRDDEKEIAVLWQQELAVAGLAHTTSAKKLEKDACLISVFSKYS